MTAKWTFIVVVALCLAQGLAHPHHQHLHGGKRDIIDDIIEKAFEKAREAIHDVVQNTKNVLEDGEAGIEKVVEGISSGLHIAVDTAENAVQGLGDKLVAKIEEILKDAEASGLNVTLCAEGKVSEAQQIERDAHDNIKKCVATAEQVGADVKAAFEKEVQTVEDNLDKTEQEIVSCIPEEPHHSLAEAEKVAKCFTEEVVTIHEQNKQTLASIAVQVTEANLKVKNAIEEAVKCVNSEVPDALSKEQALLDEVNKCITQNP
ncbi:uncharacterized protein [Anabrus simplex]|uniref:uncharacterized protein n=1 Tax=Anabrus simplex TaxID=316456 RepID=UPI0035A387BE